MRYSHMDRKRDQSLSTVEPVLKDHPIGHTNVASQHAQDRWSLVTGSITLKLGLSDRNIWSFKAGGLSWQ